MRIARLLKGYFREYPLVWFVLALVVLGAVLALAMNNKTSEEGVVEARAKQVEVVLAGDSFFLETLGHVERQDQITLRATSNGVVSWAGRSGESVKAGQMLVRLADTYAGTSIADAGLALANRQAAFQDDVVGDQLNILDVTSDGLNQSDQVMVKIARRQSAINKKSALLAQDVAHLASQQAASQSALTRTTAPFAGTLEAVYVQKNDIVTAGMPVALLSAPHGGRVQIDVSLGEAKASQIDVLGTAEVTLPDGEILEAAIDHLSAIPNEYGVYTVSLSIDGSKGGSQELADGKDVSVRLPIETREKRIVPLEALHFSALETEVLAVQDGRATAFPVVILDTFGEYAEIQIQNEGGQNLPIVVTRSIRVGDQVTVTATK